MSLKLSILQMVLMIFSVSYAISCSEEDALDANLGETAAKKKKSTKRRSNSSVSQVTNFVPGQPLAHPLGQGLPVIMVPCLDPRTYLESSQDLINVVRSQNWGIPSHYAYYFAYAHFLTSGYKENRPGNNCGSDLVGFNEESYLAANEDVQRDLGGKYIAPGLTHWILSGRSENRPGGPVSGAGAPVLGLQSSLPYFSPEWYLAENADLLRAVDPQCSSAARTTKIDFAKKHFFEHGYREAGRRGVDVLGIEKFNPDTYKAANTDLAGFSPQQLLEHWIVSGRSEFRDGSGLPGLPRSAVRNFVASHPIRQDAKLHAIVKVALPAQPDQPFLIVKTRNFLTGAIELGTLFTGPQSMSADRLNKMLDDIVNGFNSLIARVPQNDQGSLLIYGSLYGESSARSLILTLKKNNGDHVSTLGASNVRVNPSIELESFILHMMGSENAWLPSRIHLEFLKQRTKRTSGTISDTRFVVRPDIIKL